MFKGDYSQKTVYSDHPEELAQTFEKAGATYLHVVDLDGAKDGLAKNLETIKAIRKMLLAHPQSKALARRIMPLQS